MCSHRRLLKGQQISMVILTIDILINLSSKDAN